MSEEHVCEECGDAFDSRRGLHIHIGEMHPDKKEELFEEKNDKKQHECEECGKSFDSERGLHIHIGEMHPDNKDELMGKDEKEDSDDADKESKDSERGILRKHVFKNPLRVSIIILLVVIAFLSMTLIDGVPVEDDMTEDSETEFGSRVGELMDIIPEFQAAETEIVDKEVVSGISVVDVEITFNQQTETMSFHGTSDGEKIFFEVLETGEEDRGELSIEEAGEIASNTLKDYLEETSEAPMDVSATFEGSDGEMSGVYHTSISLETDEYPEEQVESFITKDGQLFFPQGENIDEMIEVYEEAEEEPVEGQQEERVETVSLSDEEKEDFTQCVSDTATLYGAEWCGFTDQQEEVFGEHFENLDYVECTENEEKCQEAGIEGYPAWEIEGEIHSGLRQIPELSELTGCEYEEKEDTETETTGQGTDDDLVECLDDNDVLIYGAEWCPYCTELAESFGGYDVVDPIWVECTEEEQRCQEEMIDEGVPEIQIDGEKYEGERNPASIGDSVGC